MSNNVMNNMIGMNMSMGWCGNTSSEWPPAI